MNETIEHGIDPALIEALQAAAAHHTQPAGALATVVNLARTAGRSPDDLRMSVEAARDAVTEDRVRQNLDTFLDGLTGGVTELVPPPRPYL